METQANSSPLQFLNRIRNLDPRRRRKRGRDQESAQVGNDIRCVAKTRRGMHEYGVQDLSVSGALLNGGPRLRERSPLIVLLRVPLYPEVRIPARVVQVDSDEHGDPVMAIEFAHRSDVTEDHIQAALLSELERSRTDGNIAELLLA